MGKRKRHDRNADQRTGNNESTKTHESRRAEATSAAKDLQTTGSSKDAFTSEYIAASDKQRGEITRVEAPTETQVEAQPKRKKLKKEGKSHRDSKAADSSTMPPDPDSPLQAQGSSTTGVVYDESLLPDQLMPQGLSRHQRRRWRRKLIRHDVMPKAEYSGSVDGEQQARARQSIRENYVDRRPQPMTSAREDDVAWADKPIGKKALARQLATTPLMQAPARRWDAPTTGRDRDQFTPWQRSAAVSGRVVLPSSTIVGTTDAKSVVASSTAASGVPVIRTTSPEDRRASAARQSTTSNVSLRSSLPSALAPPVRAKRSSFSNKANSVPTYSVDGDISERFRRFSAAAHGKAVDDTSDESSEVSSDSDLNDPALESAKVPTKARLQVDGGAESTVAHKTANEDASQSNTFSCVDELTTCSELMSRPRKPSQSNVGVKRTIFGSEVGGGRSTTAPAPEREHDSQLSVSGEQQQRFAPHETIDDESFDAHQAIDEIFQNEMTLTRELPAGKRAFNVDLECEDGHLTRDSSYTRVTRSASKPKAAIPVKRTDSAIPDPDLGHEVVVVQSVRLPENEDVVAQTSGGPLNGNYDIGDEVTGAIGTRLDPQISATAPLRQRSSSPLSELSKTPSPPKGKPGRSTPSALDQTDRTVDEGSEGNTIAVAKVQQTQQPKKKRKMTGRTSKHFSTLKTKQKRPKTQPVAEDLLASESLQDRSTVQDDRPGQKRKRSTPTKDLLAQAKGFVDDGAAEVEQVSPQRPKERTRRSSGTLANLSDANIVESRSRRSGEMVHLEDEAREAFDDGDDVTMEGSDPAAGNAMEKHEPKPEPNPNAKPKPSKRLRRSSGTLANLDSSNIIESRSRSSASKTDFNGSQKVNEIDDRALEEQTGNTTLDGPGESSKPKKRLPPSGGKITDLDDSNILDSRSRRRKESAEPVVNGLVDLKDAELNATEAPAEAFPASKKRKRSSTAKQGGRITDLDDSNILESRSRQTTEPADPEVSELIDLDEAKPDAAEAPAEEANVTKKPKRKSTGKRSIYFIPPKPALDPEITDRVDYYNTTGKKKGRIPAGVSTAPVPPIHSDRFGIIQEKLWREPFWLLIAVTFLNKTTGRAAAPVFWRLKEKYVTAEALANADQEELCGMIWHLGLQTQRSKRMISMAKAWVEAEPVRGFRWRCLHYPEKGDGKGLKPSEAVEEDAEDISGAIEIGRIPGCGPYAMDSWRIFCRDVLRGVAEDYNGKEAETEGFVPEWQKVLPGDKELRACLRWMWLREGWIWDHETGEKRRATEEEMERAVQGEMEVADSVERKFAARAAGKEAVEEGGYEIAGAEGKGEDALEGAALPRPESVEGKQSKRRTSRGTKRAATPEMEEEVHEGKDIFEVPTSPQAERAGAKPRKRKASRGTKRAATPEMEQEDGQSDNIVVSSPAKKRRTSGRTAAPRTLDD